MTHKDRTSGAKSMLNEIEVKTVRELDILVRSVQSSVEKGFDRMHSDMQTMSLDLKQLQTGRIATLEKDTSEMKTQFALMSKGLASMEKFIWSAIAFVLATVGGLIAWKLTGH